MSYTSFVRSYAPQALSTSAVDLTANGLTNIVNETEAGVLHAVGVAINTVVLTTATVNVEIQVDGGSTVSIPLFAASASFSASWKALTGSGVSGVNDFRTLILNAPYTTSLRVGINVTTAAGVTGNLQATVLRSKRV